jgi:hypothetical protein
MSNVFDCVTLDRKVATGRFALTDGTDYSSKGLGGCFGIKNVLPESR